MGRPAFQRIMNFDLKADLIGNEIADKISSVDKSKEKTKKVEEIHIPPGKRLQIIGDFKLL